MITVSDIVKFLAKVRQEEAFTIKNQKYFEEKYRKVWEVFEKNGEVCITDKDKVCAVILKDRRLICIALSVFGSSFEIEEVVKSSNLDYKITHEMVGQENCTRFSGDYLKIVLELCKKGNPKISMKRDYPLRIELDEIGLIFVLAPRTD